MEKVIRQRKISNLAMRGVLIVLLSISLVIPSLAAQEFDHTHKVYDVILKAYVSDGNVDYQTLSANPWALNRYLGALAAVSERQFQGWTETQRQAFLFNLYNAATLKLILDHYPVKSIKDIGGWFKGPWDQKIVRLFGTTITLNNLEHDILRREYNEPRLHLALVCAAKGCPPLRSKAYSAKKLDAQLNEQARIYLAGPTGLRIDRSTRTVYFSSIFKWYGKDFVDRYTPGSGFVELGTIERAVAGFCSRYVPEQDRTYIKAGGYTVKYLDYDWSLNE